jgi:bacterioferritin
MRGNEKVIAALNEALREELTAINQYFLHSEMCASWGYRRLSGIIRKSSIEEMRHAEAVIERLLFLDASPKMEYLDLNIGESVKAQLEADQQLELKAIEMYNRCIQASQAAGDEVTRDLFTQLLKDEETHLDWLETQLHQVREMGYERYLTLQVEGDAEPR